MDYGPFGFIEKYNPKWNMWTGGGEHFSFMNQPAAAAKNFMSLAESLRPLIKTDYNTELYKDRFETACAEAVEKMWTQKLGLTQAWESGVGRLFYTLERLMRSTAVDYTIFWRQLSEIPLILQKPDWETGCAGELLVPLLPAFYEPADLETEAIRSQWLNWVREYLALLQKESCSPVEIQTAMKQQSPKYVPREWMLVEAYTAANRGDYSVVHELYELFRHPYDEQPRFEDKYYRRTADAALARPGTAYMT